MKKESIKAVVNLLSDPTGDFPMKLEERDFLMQAVNSNNSEAISRLEILMRGKDEIAGDFAEEILVERHLLEPGKMVPLIKKRLDEHRGTPCGIINDLGSCGVAAKASAPTIANYLNYSDDNVREAAKDALHKISPETYK